MASKPASVPEQTFEYSIDRLESIVNEMESDKLPLDRLLDLYEEGSRLVKACQFKLDTAEKRIEIVAHGDSGKPSLTAFDAKEPLTAAVAVAPSKIKRSVQTTVEEESDAILL